MKEYDMESIQEFYDEMNNGVNSKIRKFVVYAGYARDCERQNKEREIEELFNINGRYRHNVAHIISDSIAIVEQIDKNNVSTFTCCVNGKKNNVWFKLFDESLIYAVALKNGNEHLAEAARKLLIK